MILHPCVNSGFRIQEMFIQYNYISNLFTYKAHRLSWLGQLSGIFKLMRLINVKFENGIMVYHGFRGKYSAQSQENRNNLDNTSLASPGDFHKGFVAATVEATRLYIEYMREPPFPDGFKKTNKQTDKEMLHMLRQLLIMSSYDDKCSNLGWSKCQNIDGWSIFLD